MRFSERAIASLVSITNLQHVLGFNAPANVPTWCGKPYMNPGGQFQFPVPQSDTLLHVTLQPRYSIFLDSDHAGSLLVEASISHTIGQAYNVSSHNSERQPSFKFKVAYGDQNIVSASLAVNSTGNVFKFSLSSFKPRLEPYTISLLGLAQNSNTTYSASTQIYVLPSRSYGSAVKIDNLYGGLYVQNALNSWTGWYAIFPNGGYADGSRVTPSNISLGALDQYAAQGFNNINIVPDGGRPYQAYPIDELKIYWDRMDELNLFNLYDLRFAFMNSTRISDQVKMWKNRTTLLMWYTADEPDGWAYDLDSTKLAYDQLRALDPYHPVSLALNCQNFYFEEYSSGADIIFEDAYPVSINATWSIPWNTPCNTTYGDCGCDNCIGELTDVSSRLDDIQTYQSYIPNQPRKPTWAVLQAFGQQDYWPLLPTAAEVANMMMLSINHNAKGITYWIYPSDALAPSAELGKVFQGEPAIDFVFGADALKLSAVGVDASAWILGTKMMVSAASLSYIDQTGIVSIRLPQRAAGVERVLFGAGGWRVRGDQLWRKGISGLGVSVLILKTL